MSGEDYEARNFMISKYYSFNVMNKDKTSGADSTYQEQERCIYIVWVGKSEKNRLGGHRRR